ncbi:hypothetical protein H4S03_008829, partial [Coemansia sp. S3946]
DVEVAMVEVGAEETTSSSEVTRLLLSVEVLGISDQVDAVVSVVGEWVETTVVGEDTGVAKVEVGVGGVDVDNVVIDVD